MEFKSEHELQVACVSWLRRHPGYSFLTPVFYSVPNGGYRSAATAGKMQAEGQQPGIADLCLDLPSFVDGKQYHGLRIEMKTDKGKQSDHQVIYEAYCKMSGYMYVVCRSIDDFQREIYRWLDGVDRELIPPMKELWRVFSSTQEQKKANRKVLGPRQSNKRRQQSVSDARKELSAVLGRSFDDCQRSASSQYEKKNVSILN